MNRAIFDKIANVDLNSRRRLTVLWPDELSALDDQDPGSALDQQAVDFGVNGNISQLHPAAVGSFDGAFKSEISR